MSRRVQRRPGADLGKAVFVGRGTCWANPFHIGQTHLLAVHPSELDRKPVAYGIEYSVEGRKGLPLVHLWEAPLTLPSVLGLYKAHILERFGQSHVSRELGGRQLACWCALDQPCHADVLLSLANARSNPSAFASD
ncbi:protein of unknown function [Arboricoccus pini]|uniref:DUF4326 domain-containing protein n=1 Tax=Arboricoccus pini TaxID=1963835 RepID=A0A212RCI1_9PROT|nr:DUF4326 domain-containing protein [Arboricoccus pini]SNB69963.1 protein of unknown function [Arboricoccus pini]